MEDRKIKSSDFITMRKWQWWVLSLGFMFLAIAIDGFFLKDYGRIAFFGGISLVILGFTLFKMAHDIELNTRNGVKRFWWWLLKAS